MSIFTQQLYWHSANSPSVAEREAHAALAMLAHEWQKRNTAEKVAKALKARGDLPF
jgi:hypothetical protein